MEDAETTAEVGLTTPPDTPRGSTAGPVLQWDVYVTPGIPIVMAEQPPIGGETYFQATASTLIYGTRDAVLVDAYMTTQQANALADWVASKGRNLTIIYITHGHGDHWFGVSTLLERFPDTRVLATPETLGVMRANASPQALDGAWKSGFPGQIPDKLVMAEALEGNVIDLEGIALSSCNSATPTRITRPASMSHQSASWSPATPPTTTCTSTSPSRRLRTARSGSSR